MKVKIRNRKFYVIYDSSYIYPKPQQELYRNSLQNPIFIILFQNHEKQNQGRNKQYRKVQQRNFKSKIFCLHIFRGEGHFPGLKAKWRERSEAQGCPYKRYAKSIQKQFELIQERNTWYCERAEPKISHRPSVSLNHFFSLCFPIPQEYPAFKPRPKRPASLGNMGRVFKKFMNTTSKQREVF